MVYIAQQSFGAGEVDPNIRAQYDSVPYRTGCQILENAYLSDTGSALKRWGSTVFSESSGQYKGFSFVNSYGESYYILNTVESGTSGYKIVRASNGSVISTYTNSEASNSSEYVKDIASSGTQLFVMTIEGVYSHLIFADKDKRTYLTDLNLGILQSINPVPLVVIKHPEGSTHYEGLKVTSGSSVFKKSDIGTLWKLMPGSSSADITPVFRELDARNFQDSFNPTSETLNAPDYPFVSETEVRMENYFVDEAENPDKYGVAKNVYLKHGHPVSNNTLVATHTLTNQQGGSTGGFNAAYCRIYNLGSLDIQYKIDTSQPFTPYKEGELIAFTLTNGSKNIAFESTYNTVTGTQSAETIIKIENREGGTATRDFWQFPNASITPNIQIPVNDQLAEDQYDWAGPYTNWVTVGKVFTNYSGTENVTGVIKNATWNSNLSQTPVLLSTLVTDAGSSASLITDDHKKALTQGAVGVIEQCIGASIYNKTFFYVLKKKFVEDNGTKVPNNTDDPYVVLITGQPLIPPVAVDADNSMYTTLKIRLASSTDGSGTNRTSDGLAVNRNGLFSDALVRDNNYRVGLVGSPSASVEITSYDVAGYGTDTNIINSTTAFTNKVFLTNLVGDTNPGPRTNTFRVGQLEIDNDRINLFNTSTEGQAASYYWKLTEEAFNPVTAFGETKEVLAYSEIVEYHQERLFISGFSISDLIKDISIAQMAPLTILASKSGQPRDFTIGPNGGDGLSFSVVSKVGGYIQWLRSIGNTLFVGSDEEEFIIADTPMTPTTINISRQSNYGSREDVSAKIYGNSVLYVTKDGKSIRSLNFNENTNRFESEDLLQYAKHLTKTERIKKIEVVHTGTPLLMALTDSGKLFCFTQKKQNSVYGWSEWANSQLGTFSEIVSGRDSSGNSCIFARCSALFSGAGSVLITSDDTRLDYLLDYATEIETDQSTALSSVTSTAYANKTVSVIVKKTTGEEVYVGDYVASGLGVITFGGLSFNNVDKVILGLPYTMKLAPNIPEVMLPGKGSTLGREKNISRLRILFNQVLGAIASGYDVFPVPLDTKDAVPTNQMGFYSIPVVGEYGPQPTIIIQQSAPYQFEVSGYNAEYEFGD